MAKDSSAKDIAVTSITRVLKTRNHFVQGDYGTLVNQYKKAVPTMLSTETVLLLFLSAVWLGETLETDRWGEEIKRRHYTQEVIDWVTELKTSTR